MKHVRAVGLGAAGLVAGAGLLLGATSAGATQIGSAPCPSPQRLPGGSQLTLCSQGTYVDPVGVTHVLGFVRNDGPTVDEPAMQVFVTSTSGTTSTQTSYAPVLGLLHGASTPIDAELDGTVANFTIVGLTADVAQSEPEEAFTFTGVTVATNSSSAAAVSGDVVNDNGKTVIGVKIGYVAFTTAGAIAWYGPDIQQGAHQTIPAGASTAFVVYRRDVPADAVISADSPFLFAQGNEPAAVLPTPSAQPASGRSPVPVTRTVPSRTTPQSHAVVTNPLPAAGIRPPTVADLAQAAHPGTVTPSHDAHAVRRAAGPLPALVDAGKPVASTGPGATQWLAPLVLLLVLAFFATRMLGRDAAVAREARSERRRAKAARRAGVVVTAEQLADPEYAAPVSRRRG